MKKWGLGYGGQFHTNHMPWFGAFVNRNVGKVYLAQKHHAKWGLRSPLVYPQPRMFTAIRYDDDNNSDDNDN